jgi:hypothetical protein
MMKDKLVKYHHKAIYYRVRKVALVMFFVVLTSAAVAIPISIMTVAAREAESSENQSSNDESSLETEASPSAWLSL